MCAVIANVSHELRTPLTSTIGFIETILRDDIELSDEDRVRIPVGGPAVDDPAAG